MTQTTDESRRVNGQAWPVAGSATGNLDSVITMATIPNRIPHNPVIRRQRAAAYSLVAAAAPRPLAGNRPRLCRGAATADILSQMVFRRGKAGAKVRQRNDRTE